MYYSGWSEQTAFGKATAIGIPFHSGEFGLWNQALLLVFGVGAVFGIVTGGDVLQAARPWLHGLAGAGCGRLEKCASGGLGRNVGHVCFDALVGLFVCCGAGDRGLLVVACQGCSQSMSLRRALYDANAAQRQLLLHCRLVGRNSAAQPLLKAVGRRRGA